MDQISYFLSGMDYILDSKRKRHLVGGFLLSVSSMFFGIAITIITLSSKKESEELEEHDI